MIPNSLDQRETFLSFYTFCTDDANNMFFSFFNCLFFYRLRLEMKAFSTRDVTSGFVMLAESQNFSHFLIANINIVIGGSLVMLKECC